ncbi:MAG TPA: FUSC family protein, partial [Gammaproteobacteria bacterium]|nr:FUSC family protein [Gammaproteobacteria bacterium]
MFRSSLTYRLDFLLRPPRPAILFALRVLVTALLALLLAILLGLKNPHWATMTTIVVAQPTRGAAFAKGFYRIVGSLIGAAAGVAMLALLRPYPAALI